MPRRAGNMSSRKSPGGVQSGEMSTRAPLTIVVGLVLAIALTFGGDAGARQEAAFEVASVRPNTSAANSELRALPTGRLVATNVTLRRLIQRAYRLHDAQIIGTPEWAASERFDVDARMAAPPVGGPDAVFPLLQPLLADRFRLRAHMETRELPAYVLVITQRNKPGAQIRPTAADCTKATTLTQEEIRANARDGWPPCGMSYTVAYVVSGGSGNQLAQSRIRRSGTTMRDFAAALQEGLDRPVVDGTGLEGRFDVEYTHAPQPPTAGAPDSPFGPPPPMLFVALEEQLGMKLDSRRTQMPVLVIDTVERATAN
jgi:uncharacterized protein (TIGR03435 family)